MKRFFSKKILMSTMFAAASVLSYGSELPVWAETEGNGIKNGVIGSVNDKSVIYLSEIDGTVSQNNIDGTNRWRIESDEPAVAFKIMAIDITGDNNDDLLMASGNGHLYAWDSSGELLWKFGTDTKLRFNAVSVWGKGKDATIFCGGNNYTMYELNTRGEKLSETLLDGSIREIMCGDFMEEGKPSIFVYTLLHNKFGSKFFGFIDFKTKKVIKESALSDIAPSGLMVHNIKLTDFNKDGKNDLLFSGSARGAHMFVMDGDFEKIVTYQGSSEDSQRYAYTMSESLQPLRDEIVMQMGGVMYHINSKGGLLSKSGAPYKGVIYNELLFDNRSHSLIGCGQIGGDNTLYYYDLDDGKWFRRDHEFHGRYKEIEDNVKKLYEQSFSFKMPSYQKRSDKNYCMVYGASLVEQNQTYWVESKGDPKINWLDSRLDSLDGCGVDVTTEFIISEDYDRQHIVDAVGPMWGTKRDTRKHYVLTQKQIVDWAAEQEKNGNNFSIWAGHVTDPFFMHITTLEKIIAAAPTCCKGLLYAEMVHVTDPRTIYFVKEQMPRIAKAIRENNSQAKLFFRYKNLFWGADCHSDLWRKLFFSKEYKDIIIPAAEDTGSRIQETSITGRIGMFASDYVNDFSLRLVDDNPTSWRPYSPGAQRSVSQYLRHAALLASYGSRYGVLFDINYLEDPGYNSFIALIKSGIIPVVEREDILSIGSWMLSKDIEEEYVEGNINNSHDLINYSTIDNDMVFSNAGGHWSGTSVQDHDYSKMLGIDYRWLNFMPEMPNGMIPIADIEYEKVLKRDGEKYFVSNICEGYIKGKKVGGKEFGPYMKKIVEEGAAKLILRVEGASWGFFKIDDTHARLVLIDPGYIDPRERNAELFFQTMKPIAATDILTGEKFDVAGKNGINVTVPAGSMRFIDIEYSEPIKK